MRLDRCGLLNFHAAILCLVCGSGCASLPYQYGESRSTSLQRNQPQTVVIEYGQPNETLDRIGWFVGLPKRILPMNSKIDNHHVSPETIDRVKDYLERNDLADVAVTVNQYDPKGQWRRLRENRLVAPGWRYTVGVLSVAGYTLRPGRIFGGDTYNPYTNSLCINSDVSAVILREAAIAKDIHHRDMPGTYAFVSDLPVISLWRHSHAIGDVTGYAQEQEDWIVEKQVYHVLYPQFGVQTTSMAGMFYPVWWAMPLFGLPGAMAGHVSGRMIAARREAEIRKADHVDEVPAGQVKLTGHIED